MKKYFLLLLVFTSVKTFSQTNFVDDSVSLLPGYRQDVFYDLGYAIPTGTDSSHNWDIAFATDLMSVGMLANHTNGITVYKTPYAPADFSTLDTSGYNAGKNKKE